MKKNSASEDRARCAKLTKEERQQAADNALREAIRETGGASFVIMYGPVCVGKMTMENHRLCDAESRNILQAVDLSYTAQIPLFQVLSSPLSASDEGEDDDDENTVGDVKIYGDYE